jgi:hypothetical protein
MNHKPNLIKVAVEAAGGRTVAAERLGVDRWTITNWQRGGRVPSQHIRALCALGENIITPEALLAYIEQAGERVEA